MGEESKEQEVPKEFGKYRILSKIGATGFAALYLAEDPILGRKVSLKVLSRKIAEDESALERFYQEARATAGFEHPSITTLHEMGEQDGYHYLVTQFVEGRSLDELAGSNDAPPLHVILKMMATVAGALQHVHERGIVHRDVKPLNIMIGPSGDPVLVNFGICAPTSRDPLQDEGTAVGTPHYMSPEQAKGELPDPRSDTYNLGATMYHLLAGQTMFDAKTIGEIMGKHISEPVDLSPLEGKAPEYVISIIARCLQKDPDDRYQSADELRRALEAAVDHLEMAGAETMELAPPRPGQVLLLHVEYQEADLPGSYREYEIGPYLGGGTFGEVFRATERLSGKEMALKFLKRQWLTNEEVVTRFRREATLYSRLSHPNILRVHNFGRYGPSFFMAMDLLEGPDLDEVIGERAPMDVAEALSYAVPVLEGIAAMHNAGVIHRDLKPANVAIRDGAPVVFDFGMAHVDDLTKLTMSRDILGTPRYMSPEQASGRGVTSWSDVYAAGVMLYEMLTGTVPHKAETEYGLLRKIATEPPPPVTDHRSDLPAALCAAVDGMLARDPVERPTAAEAAKMLASLDE